MNYPETIENLIECFKKLPGVGLRSAERYALSVLSFDDEIIDLFAKSLKNSKLKIKSCSRCGYYCEGDLCEICLDKSRDSNTLCIVEDPKNVKMLEDTHIFNGYYYVLNGLISPMDGMDVDDLNISQLMDLIEKEDIKEIIIAVKPSIEGETTALYINELLREKDIVVTRIAQGVPMGADIDYVDALTLEMALENRKKLNN